MESMRDSIIDIDALERNAIVGHIYVDLDEKEVTAAYIEEKNGKVHTLSPSSKLQIVTEEKEGIQYHDITGQDVIDRKTNYGDPLFAGMKALLYNIGNTH